ncbi:hypothetical protein GGI06_004151, partial [Coemansia sp. S85]
MGHSRGYAFVNMANVSDAQRARDSLNDTVVHDRARIRARHYAPMDIVDRHRDALDTLTIT